MTMTGNTDAGGKGENDMSNPTLRTKIARYLGSVESATADEIGMAVDLPHSTSTVINALNTMRTDALVECEREGKKMQYWLSVPLEQIAEDSTVDPIDLPSEIKPGTRGAQVWECLRAGARLKASELTTMLQLNQGALDPTLSDLYKTGVIARSKSMGGVFRYHRPINAAPQPEVGKNTGSSASDVTSTTTPAEGAAVLTDPAPVPDVAASQPVAADDTDEEMPPADPALLASANRMLCERLEGVAHALRGSGLPGLREVTGSEDLQPHVAALAVAYRVALRQIEVVSDRLADVVEGGDIEASEMHVKELAVRAAAELKNARARVESLQHEVDKLRESLQGRPGVCASQIDSFLMLAAKRKPRRITKIDNARAAAVSAIRAGAQRAEVFALVPIAEAVRGVEWLEVKP